MIWSEQVSLSFCWLYMLFKMTEPLRVGAHLPHSFTAHSYLDRFESQTDAPLTDCAHFATAVGEG